MKWLYSLPVLSFYLQAAQISPLIFAAEKTYHEKNALPVLLRLFLPAIVLPNPATGGRQQLDEIIQVLLSAYQ